jgi:hypothetical protein
MSLGIVRGFIGTMQPSDFSSACMPIVRLLPSWVGPVCWPDADEISQVPTKGRHHVHMGSPTARGSSSASHLRGEDVAFRPTERRQHLEIRPVSQLHLTPWKTCTSYPLASLLGALSSGSIVRLPQPRRPRVMRGLTARFISKRSQGRLTGTAEVPRRADRIAAAPRTENVCQKEK